MTTPSFPDWNFGSRGHWPTGDHPDETMFHYASPLRHCSGCYENHEGNGDWVQTSGVHFEAANKYAISSLWILFYCEFLCLVIFPNSVFTKEQCFQIQSSPPLPDKKSSSSSSPVQITLGLLSSYGWIGRVCVNWAITALGLCHDRGIKSQVSAPSATRPCGK